MKDAISIVDEREVDTVWGNSNFGSMSRMDVVKLGVLKCASGYHQGSTSEAIIRDLGLITQGYRLTKRGRRCLWVWFNGGSNF